MASKDLSFTALELDAAADYAETTGKNDFWKLAPAKRRKYIEQYSEDQNLSE